MLDIVMLSRQYEIRRLGDDDADAILAICRENPQFYRYSDAKPAKEQVLSDLHILPPGVEPADKYFIGFYQRDALVAVMDLIDGFPEPEIAYIGFFMMAKAFQGQQRGSAIIQETAAHLKATGKTAIRLAINKGNPQATHFWQKNGFLVLKETDRNGWPLLVAEKTL